MAANKRALITVAAKNGESPYSLHHDLAGHFRMDRAVVGIRSCLGKRIRELFVRVHHLGLEHAVCADHRVGNIITVGPDDRRSHSYGQRLRPKAEIVDLDFCICRRGLIIRLDTR